MFLVLLKKKVQRSNATIHCNEVLKLSVVEISCFLHSVGCFEEDTQSIALAFRMGIVANVLISSQTTISQCGAMGTFLSFVLVKISFVLSSDFD